MAHGKETPRQKMIGMMYLVLTALLALNVSKEAVEAFKLVDEGLTRTTANFNAKNNLTYEEFDRAAAENEAKAGPWRDAAYEVRDWSNEIFEYIQNLKIRIITEAEGEGSKALEGGEVITEEIKKYDDMNIPSQIMVGANDDGAAFDLKALLIEYREFLKEKVGTQNPSVIEALDNNLVTEDPIVYGEKVHWEHHNFQALPLVAVITMLSKSQNDVKNAEAETLNYLYSQIDAGSFKFNRLLPTVIPRTNHVIRGNDYQAEVFIAATDTTQKPEILVGNYDSTVTSSGSIQYRMVGDYESIPIDERGRGIYTSRASSLGPKKWGGLIQLVSPLDGSKISYPFKTSYTVAAPNVVVSATAMNILYTALDNPIDISVPGIPAENIRATMSNGSLTKGKVTYGNRTYRGSWIGRPTSTRNNAVITVRSVTDDGSIQNHGQIEFRVKSPPPPIAKVGGVKEGDINRSDLLAQIGVAAEVEDFEFDVKYQVTSFNVGVIVRGYLSEESSNSYRITTQQKNMIQQLRRGNNVMFTNIRAVGPDGKEHRLPAVVLKIN
jgi:gliding motility-associated protein GldM